MKTLRLWFLSLIAVFGSGLFVKPIPPADVKLPAGFVGTQQSVACHTDIGKIQLTSDHALSVRKLEALPELLKDLPLQYIDKANEVDYRLDRSATNAFELVAVKGRQTDRLQLLWAFGAGRKGLSFVGRARSGSYGQARVSWYASIRGLDITPGSKGKVQDANDALADWFEPGKREECFNCHVSHQAERPPEEIAGEHAGIQCERCHGCWTKPPRGSCRGTQTRRTRHSASRPYDGRRAVSLLWRVPPLTTRQL
ncbi:MAG: cytochrome c family protein [Acidobacteria bacterium]|nr:cytochrome c family protein [Acidobacteriota bacterium]MCI0723276.1 cytochrome c family protein [Acidobacteriota bacterium]